MKRLSIYIVAIAALWWAPVEGADIARLHPVEVVVIYQEENQVVIATDTGDVGEGDSGISALENLKATTSGTIYLDTAEYLLITEGAEDVAQELRHSLKKSVQVCMADREVDPVAAAQFLPAHITLPKLRTWNPENKLPYLKVLEKRLILL